VVRSAAFLAVGALAMTAALALACFVKATGMTFLALPRSPRARRAREVTGSMRVAMGILALGCIATGLLAGPISSWLTGVAGTVVDAQSGPVAATAPATLGNYAPVLLTLLLAALAVTGVAVLRLRAERVRRVPTWTCGIMPDPAFEYTATSFAKPIRLFFELVYRPDRDLHVELVPGTPFRRRVRYRSEVVHVVEARFYHPLHRFSLVLAQTARRLQQGTLQLYVAYIVAAVIVLLLVAR
jgi:hydrogenase-4 component B